MARRAASICRLVIQQASSAWRPYVPKASVLPRCAVPARRPRCTLRCFTRLGISMALLLLFLVRGLRGGLAPGGRLAGRLARRGRLALRRRPLGCRLVAGGEIDRDHDLLGDVVVGLSLGLGLGAGPSFGF